MSNSESVREYWERRPCGTDEDPFPEGSVEYFEWLARVRYDREPFIPKYARFDEWAGREVLEIGVGTGTDAERFARRGARFTGIDLTEHGVRLARRRFAIGGLDGRIEIGDAERLPFADGSFDFVYSWGVIHHSADTPAAAREMARVCRSGGQICCMVYSRESLYALQGKIVYGWLRGRPGRPLDEIAAEHFESPGTRLYDEPSLRALFPGLEEVRISHEVTPYDARIGRRLFLPAALRRMIPRRFGYFMILEGRKP